MKDIEGIPKRNQAGAKVALTALGEEFIQKLITWAEYRERAKKIIENHKS